MGGACCSSNGTRNRSPQASRRVRKLRMGNFYYQLYSKLYTGGEYTGEGCKRTNAWDTNATEEEVRQKRQEFWDTRIEGNVQVWQVLKAAIEENDTNLASQLVLASGLTMVNGSLNSVTDETNYRYDVPVFVINEPKSYGKGTSQVPVKLVEEKQINIKLRCGELEDMTLTISNEEDVGRIKSEFSSYHKLERKAVRMFFNGRELKGGLSIGEYGIESEHVVQVSTSDLN